MLSRARRSLGRARFPFELLFCALLFGLQPAAAGAAVQWVDSSDPSCGGQTPCHPTIQAGVDAAGAGDTVRVLPGTYPERVTIVDKNSAGSTEADRIRIEADPAAAIGSVLVSGTAADCETGGTIKLNNSHFVTIEGLAVTGIGTQGIVLGGNAAANSHVELIGNRVFGVGPMAGGCGNGIRVRTGNDEVLIANNLVHDNRRMGVRVSGSTAVRLLGNSIVGNAQHGVRLNAGSTVSLVNNAIVGNGTDVANYGNNRRGIRQANNADPASTLLLGNLVCGNGLSELRGALLDAADASNLTPTGSEGTGVSASIGCDTLANVFADQAGADTQLGTEDDDFTLASTSPAVDAGVDPVAAGLPATVANLDFSGAARPVGSAYDIGAFERMTLVAPDVEITSPLDGDVLGASSVAVSGTIAPAGTPVDVNGQAATVVGTSWSVTLALADGATTITASASNVAGSDSAAVSIIVDTVVPAIAFTAPAGGALLSQSPVQVSGTVVDSTAVPTVDLNGQILPVVGGSFSGSVVLAEGANPLTATAVDQAGNVGQASLSVTLDTTPPAISISTPPDGTLTASAMIAVQGSADDANGITAVDVNGTVATLSGTSWSANVPLVLGAQTLTATATDAAGNVAQAAVTVTRGDLPTIAITAPADGSLTNQATLAVSGTVTNSVSVDVNGTAATVTGTAWTAQIAMAEGANTIVATASNAFASVQTDITVSRDTIAPLVTLDVPPDGTVFTSEPIGVFGTVADANPIAALTLNGNPITPGNAFSEVVPLVTGANTITIVATDAAGNSGQASVTVTLEVLAIAITSPADGSTTTAATATVAGTVNDSGASVSVNGVAAPLTGLAWSANVPLGAGSNLVTATATLGAQTAVATRTVVQVQNPPPPPPPEPVASSIDPTVVTSLADATAFLYTGPNPVQTSVAPGTIEPLRAGVIRGRILDGSGDPLESVSVSIVDRPELGQTISRVDGFFDLAVNAGGAITVLMEREGFSPVRRTSRLGWREFDRLDDVAMLLRSPLVATVDTSGAAAFTVVQGAVESDALHTRQATLLIPKDTIATAVLPGGGTTSLGTSFAVRVTELTVGPLAVNALPAEMPIGGDPTNVWDVVLDEAIALGSEHVEFDQPISFYVETTSAFSVGDEAPSISFDPEQGIWLDNATGVVLEILSETGGVADLDTDGDGMADDAATLATHGITLDEQIELATLYSPGATLRRYPTTRFSGMCGHSIAFPFGATPPGQGSPDTHGCDSCKQAGNNTPSRSLIRTGRQVWAEQVDLTGSPYNLHYESDRAPGYRAANTIRIPLTDATPPAPLQAVNLEVEVAGRKFAFDFPPLPNLSHTFVWDGLDAYGRALQGRQPVRIRIAYQYQGFTDGRRTPVYKFQRMKFRLGPFDARGVGIGGWTLSPHHVYDPLSEVLYRGDGERRTGGELPAIVINRAGITQGLPSNPGPKPSERSFQFMANALGTGPDGMFYISENFGFPKVHQVDPATDTITEIGTLPSSALVGDIAIGPDGAIYTSSSGRHAIYRMDLTGAVSVFAGQDGTSGFSGDSGPASTALLSFPNALDFGPDGSLYISDSGNYRIRRVKPDGTIETFAGDGVFGSPSGIPGDAKVATLGTMQTLEVNDDGEVFIGEIGNRVYQINDTGYIEVFAGTGSSQANLPDPSGIGDGGPPADANIGSPRDIAIGADGSVYIATGGGSTAAFRLRRVRPDGIIETVFGTGTNSAISGANTGSGKIARRVDSLPTATDVLPDGTLLVLDRTTSSRSLVWSVEPPLPGFSIGNYLVASRDGRELYIFDSSGAHLETRDALMEAQLLTFQYTPEGTLDKIVDADLNETTIVRDPNGIVTGIQPPFGPATDLTVDANGYLATISNPLNEAHTITSSGDGMIALFAKPGGNATTTLTYDSAGRLILDEDPEGGFFAITRTETVNELTVTTSSATGVSKSTVLRREVNGDLANERVREDGLISTLVETPDGATTLDSPDGTSVTSSSAPDPRLSMAAPILELLEITTPGVGTFKRELTRDIDTDLVTGKLIRQTDTITINNQIGSPTVIEYFVDGDPATAAEATIATTTAEGRQIFDDLDDHGRLIATNASGLEQVVLGYDAAGRLDSLAQGTGANERLVTFTYDIAGNLQSVTDPLLREITFEYDAAGRVTKQVLPDLREINFTYDVRGNLASLTPPGQPAHVFLYSGLDQQEEYAPPTLPLVPMPSTIFIYDLDRNLDLVVRPDGKTVDFAYDAAGRLSTTTTLRGQTIRTYDPTTGNLSSILAPAGELLTLGYAGRLVSSLVSAGTVSGTVSRSFDNQFRIATEGVGGGATIAFAYNDDDFPIQVGALTLATDPATGRLAGTQLGATETTTLFNGFGELAADNALVSGSSLFANVYVRDKLGRILRKTETIQGATTVIDYHYGLGGRLERVDKDGLVARIYSYDLNGNRLSATDGGHVENSQYDAQDRLLTAGTRTYTYNAAGDLQQIEDSALPPAQRITDYSYDAVGNLVQVTLPDGRTIEYVIDGRNNRVGKKVNGTLVQGLLYSDEGRPVAEVDQAGAVVSRFVYASRPHVPDYLIRLGVEYRIITDDLGSPRLVVDATTGVVHQRIDYDEFGNVTTDTNPGFQPFGYAGGLRDYDTKLVRIGRRDYEPSSGRWTTQDPVLFVGSPANLYSYVLADPVNFIDTNGESALSAAAGWAGAGLTGAGLSVGAIVGVVGGVVVVGAAVACYSSDACRRQASCAAQYAADIASCTGKGLCAADATTDSTLACLAKAANDYRLCRSGLRLVPGGSGIRTSPAGNLRPVK